MSDRLTNPGSGEPRTGLPPSTIVEYLYADGGDHSQVVERATKLNEACGQLVDFDEAHGLLGVIDEDRLMVVASGMDDSLCEVLYAIHSGEGGLFELEGVVLPDRTYVGAAIRTVTREGVSALIHPRYGDRDEATVRRLWHIFQIKRGLGALVESGQAADAMADA